MNQAEQEAVRKILESPAHGKRTRVTRLFKVFLLLVGGIELMNIRNN